jgi:hypothetical protein
MAVGPQDAPRHAGQVVRRVLLRRNIVIDAETAQLVADAVQAALRPAASLVRTQLRPPGQTQHWPPGKVRRGAKRGAMSQAWGASDARRAY